jgi:hypothetical protein
MAGAHIASVKFKACMCAWAGPSRSGSDLKSFAGHDSGPGRNDPETFQSSDLRLSLFRTSRAQMGLTRVLAMLMIHPSRQGFSSSANSITKFTTSADFVSNSANLLSVRKTCQQFSKFVVVSILCQQFSKFVARKQI